MRQYNPKIVWIISILVLVFLISGIFYFIEPEWGKALFTPKKTEKTELLQMYNDSLARLGDFPDNIISDEISFISIPLPGNPVLYQTPFGSVKTNPLTGACEIATLRGKCCGLILPDSSRIWMNAMSVIRYMPGYGRNTRDLELEGEAFFDVAADAGTPFKVKAGAVTASVLGTRFNISCYRNEKNARITLMNGVLDVNGYSFKRHMNPGEQVIINPNHSSFHQEDTSYVTAWKKGDFDLRQASVPFLMRELERWYDIAVVYKGGIPPGTYSFQSSRRSSLGHILDMLEDVGLHNDLEGKVLTIKQ